MNSLLDNSPLGRLRRLRQRLTGMWLASGDEDVKAELDAAIAQSKRLAQPSVTATGTRGWTLMNTGPPETDLTGNDPENGPGGS